MTRVEYLLPPVVADSYKYTLVLDLDETLVHYDAQVDAFRVRPHCRQFLSQMATLFEVVIFTAADQMWADFILDKLDPAKALIKHRLYR